MYIDLCMLHVSTSLCFMHFGFKEYLLLGGFEYVGMEVQEEEPSKEIPDKKLKLEYRKQGVLPGFKVASSSDYSLER